MLSISKAFTCVLINFSIDKEKVKERKNVEGYCGGICCKFWVMDFDCYFLLRPIINYLNFMKNLNKTKKIVKRYPGIRK
jgi:hypothetical protein